MLEISSCMNSTSHLTLLSCHFCKPFSACFLKIKNFENSERDIHPVDFQKELYMEHVAFIRCPSGLASRGTQPKIHL